MRKLIPLCGDLAEEIGQLGWRQRKHLYKKIKQLAATISRIAASKSPKGKAA